MSDLIVSNPPFFTKQIESTKEKRNLARHEKDLTLDVLLSDVKTLLSDKGSFFILLPSTRKKELITKANEFGYGVRLLRDIKGSHRKAAKTFMAELIKDNSKTDYEEVLVYQNPGEYSEEIKKLLKPFLLKL